MRKTKASEPYESDLLDESGNTLVEHIVEDEDQGPQWSGVVMGGIIIVILLLKKYQKQMMGKLCVCLL